MSDPEIELPEKIKIAERAAILYEVAIPGLCLAVVLCVVGFISQDSIMMLIGLCIGAAGALIGQTAKHYKRKVMGP